MDIFTTNCVNYLATSANGTVARLRNSNLALVKVILKGHPEEKFCFTILNDKCS